MKLILTESQYKLLESIIEEATKAFSTKIEKGGFIEVRYMHNNNEESYEFEITDIYGTGQYVGATSKGKNYIINIGGSLDVNNNTFTVLRDAQYKDVGNGPEVVGGVRQRANNVTGVDVRDASRSTVDEILTDLGEENSGESKEEKKERKKEYKRKEKEMYDELMNDPLFKKAFYHQPTILNGLLKYGKAKGIGPAKALVSKYIGGNKNTNDKDDTKNNKGNFKVNQHVKVMLGNTSVNLKYDKEEFILPSKTIFKPKFNTQSNLVGTEKMDGKIYKYQIINIKNIKDDIYKGDINVEFKGNSAGVIDRRQKDIKFKVIQYVTN